MQKDETRIVIGSRSSFGGASVELHTLLSVLPVQTWKLQQSVHDAH